MTWENKTLGDVSISIQTGPFGSQLHQSDYSASGTPVVMPKDLAGGKIVTDSIARVPAIHVERLCQHKITPNDILYSRRGDVGRCAFATDEEAGWLCGTGCLRVTIDKSTANPKFVFYQLQTSGSIGWVEKHAVGSTMLNLNTSILSHVPIILPNKKIQDKIADILSAYDDLIENNQKQIKLLEEVAQRLYKEWFVDFRFPGHETTPFHDGLPEGWERKTIGELISYEIGGGWGEETITCNAENGAFVIRGTDLFGLTHGNLMEIPFRYHGAKDLLARTLRDGDIVFEVSGGSKTEGVARTTLIRTKMLKRWASPVMCASFCKLIRPISLDFSQYLFDHFQYLRLSGKTEEYDKRSASSIVNYRWKDFLSQEIMYKPSKVIINQYNKIARFIYDQMIDKSLQIETAQNARDRLLPKLMSREIQV